MVEENDKIEFLNLTGGTLNRLKGKGIFLIKDLLSLEYKDLISINGIGEVRKKEIKDKLHNFGFKLKEEEKDYKIKRENFKNSNIELLEDLGLNMKICHRLYRKDIFTFDDLCNNLDKLRIFYNFKDEGEETILEFIKNIKYKEYLSLKEKKDKINHISFLTKIISSELEKDIIISKKELLLKQLKEIFLELEILLDEDQKRGKTYEKSGTISTSR